MPLVKVFLNYVSIYINHYCKRRYERAKIYLEINYSLHYNSRMPVKNAERRQFYRHPIEVPIRITESSRRHPTQHTSRNVSAGGICFLSDHPIPKGVSIHVAIPIHDQLFKLRGEVAYAAPDNKTGLFQTGVQFRDSLNLYRAKLAEEILDLEKYCKSLTDKRGSTIPRQEAEKKWVRKNARRFAAFFGNA